jgi:DNA-binding HxlR family transcriptional regulator
MDENELAQNLSELIDKGLVDLIWSEEENDFMYCLTPKGEELTNADD